VPNIAKVVGPTSSKGFLVFNNSVPAQHCGIAVNRQYRAISFNLAIPVKVVTTNPDVPQ